MKANYLLAIPFFFAATCAMAQGTLDTGLIRNYPFTGNANDASVTGDNGTVTGATLTNDRFGTPNRAYFFDGVNDRINFNPSGCDLQEFTYSVWVKIKHDSTKANGVGIYAFMYIGNAAYHDHGFSTGPNANQWTIGSYHATAGLVNIFSGVQPLTEVWQHLVFSRDADSVKLYLNGNKIGANSVGGNAAGWTGTHTAVFGARPSYSYYFRGSLDEGRIYNRALTGSEVTTLYNMQSNPPTSLNELTGLDATLFPNPIRSGMVLNINMENDLGPGAMVYLYSSSGMEIYQGGFTGNLEVPQLADGLYYVIIRSDEGIVSKKLQVTTN